MTFWIQGNPYRGGVSDISGALEMLGNQQVGVGNYQVYLNSFFWPGGHPLWEALPKKTQRRLWGLLYIRFQTYHRYLLQRQRHIWDEFWRGSSWPGDTVKWEKVDTIVQQLQQLLHTTGKQKSEDVFSACRKYQLVSFIDVSPYDWIFSCPEQLNRTHCLSLGLSDPN